METITLEQIEECGGVADAIQSAADEAEMLVVGTGMPEHAITIDGKSTPLQSAGCDELDALKWYYGQCGDCPQYIVIGGRHVAPVESDEDGRPVAIDRDNATLIDIEVPDLAAALDNADAFRQAVNWLGAPLDFVRTHEDDDELQLSDLVFAFVETYGREPDGDDDPWSDICAAWGGWAEVADAFDRLAGLRNDISSRGWTYAGDSAGEIAEEWDDEGLSEEASDWMDAGFWSPSAAASLKALDITPQRARELADEMVADSDEPSDDYTSGDPIYAICNNDLGSDALVTRYRIYEAPEGCGMSYCGEYCSLKKAQSEADDEPTGLDQSLWDTARAAGHCGGLYAPGDGEEDGDEPISWHGENRWHCVVRVRVK